VKANRYGPAPTPDAAAASVPPPTPAATAPGAARKKPKKEKPQAAKPRLPNLDPNDPKVWEETARLAREGNTKLARAVDLLREGLQTITFAEFDFSTKPPTPMTTSMIRALAAETLEAYSALTGQNWRSPRNQVVHSRAGRADHRLDKNVGNDGGDYD
jgi:hypothetical protein